MDPTPPTPIPATRAAWYLSWPALAVLLCLPGVLWAFASPLFSVPDEPSHVVKAVAMWHGQVAGDDAMRPDNYLTTTYQIPAVWAQASPFRTCFAFQPEITADCSPPFAGSESITGVDSTAGHYPPLFYVLVGWGGRLSNGPAGVYLMRIANAVLCGLFLTAAVRALMRVIDPRLALAGVLVAATPMALFLAGSVNPNGLEIAAAIAVWATLVAILRWGDRRDGPLPRQLAVQLAVAGSVVALVRPLSPAFLAAIGVLACLSVPLASVRRALRERAVLIAAAVVAASAAVGTVAIVSSGIFAAVPGRIGVGSNNPLLVIIGETDGYVAEMIGVFGWLDTRSPALTLFIWLAVVFGLFAVSLTVASTRSAVGLLLTLAATIALPIAAQYPNAAAQGLAWQGRYSLPLAVGIPLLAVVILDEQRALLRPFTARLTIAVAALTGIGTVAAFFWALRRYATGATGSLRISAAAWQPPGGSVLLVLAMVGFAIGTVAVMVLASRAGTATVDTAPAVDTSSGSASRSPRARSGLVTQPRG